MINLGSVEIEDLRLGSEKVSKAYLGDKLIWDNKSGEDAVEVEFTKRAGGRWVISTSSGKKYRLNLSGSGIVRVNNKNQTHGTVFTFTALGENTELYFFDSSIQIMRVVEV